MRALITGGFGQVGSYLADRLLARGYEVTVLHRSGRIGDPAVRTIKGDIRDRGLAGRAVAGHEVVVHCAAQNSPPLSLEDPVFDAEVNIMGTLNLLDAARRSAVERFVYFSTSAVYGNAARAPVKETDALAPVSPYGISKACGEKYALAFHDLYGLPSTVIRPFNIYSPREDPARPYGSIVSKVIGRVRSGAPPVVNTAITRDFVSVHDVVDMVALMLTNDGAVGKAFNCGTGIGTDIDTLARMVISLFGRGDLAPERHPGTGSDIGQSVADISFAKSVLGYAPKVSLAEGLRECVDAGMPPDREPRRSHQFSQAQ